MSGAPRLSIIPGWVATHAGIKGLKDLQVLCVLGQNANRQHGWTRRSQVKIAEQLGCARSTVQASINRLVDIGAVERREVVSDSGRDSAHWYRVIYDAVPPSGYDFSTWDEAEEQEFGPISETEETAPPAGTPAPPAGTPAPPAGPASAPPAGPGPAPSINTSCLTPPVEMQRESAGARNDNREDRKRIETAFWRVVKDWPNFSGMPKEPAKRPWFALTDEEREKAEAMRDPWLAMLKAQHKSQTPAPSTYFREKLWLDVPKVKEPRAAPVVSNAYSRPWMGQHFAGLAVPMRRLFWTPLEEQIIRDKPEKRDVMWRDKCLKQGWPDVTRLHEKAAEFRGVIVSSEVAEAASGFVAVKVGGEVWEAWKRLHHANHWPFVPDPGKLDYVQFPPIDETEHDLDHAVAEAVARYHKSLTAARNDDDAA